MPSPLRVNCPMRLFLLRRNCLMRCAYQAYRCLQSREEHPPISASRHRSAGQRPCPARGRRMEWQ